MHSSVRIRELPAHLGREGLHQRAAQVAGDDVLAHLLDGIVVELRC